MARKKKEDEAAVVETPPVPLTPHAPVEELKIGVPLGTRNCVTFLVKGRPPWLLQHGTRGLIKKELAKQEGIRKLKELPEEEQTKAAPRRIKSIADLELPEEIAEMATYPTSDGRYFFQANAFSGAIIDAFQTSRAVYFIDGKEKGAHLVLENSIRVEHTQSVLIDQRTLQPFRAPEEGGKPPYIIDARAVNNPQVGKVVAFRALWLHWAMFVTMSYDSAAHGEGVIRQGMALAGDRIGLGALRPYPPPKSKNPNRGRGGPYGTFTAEVWAGEIPEEARPEF
jgi:hypothetical protein